jgi:hypothetical protein
MWLENRIGAIERFLGVFGDGRAGIKQHDLYEFKKGSVCVSLGSAR